MRVSVKFFGLWIVRGRAKKPSEKAETIQKGTFSGLRWLFQDGPPFI